MVDRGEYDGRDRSGLELKPSSLESIFYPFDGLVGTYSEDSPVPYTKYLGEMVARLAYQLERYDPVLSTTLDDYKQSDEALAFSNAFYIAISLFVKAGARADERDHMRQFSAVSTLGFIERRPDLDGDDRDVIEDRARYIHRTGMEAYDKVYPSFRELFEENIELTDPGHPNERNIGLDTYAQAGAGWALLLNYDLLVTAIKDVANAEADALSADVDWDQINFGEPYGPS
jgi:hypothetical protein